MPQARIHGIRCFRSSGVTRVDSEFYVVILFGEVSTMNNTCLVSTPLILLDACTIKTVNLKNGGLIPRARASDTFKSVLSTSILVSLLYRYRTGSK